MIIVSYLTFMFFRSTKNIPIKVNLLIAHSERRLTYSESLGQTLCGWHNFEILLFVLEVLYVRTVFVWVMFLCSVYYLVYGKG